MARIILILLSLTLFQACGGKPTEDLKSPCVSTDDGPCGPRKPINNWLS